jgi:leader peptidase (prepilin peptidase) / N-methyltransferase
MMTPETIALVFAFLFGAVVGSFLNVVIFRVPRGMSIVSPPSSCGSCGTPIRWYHNVPIVSYVVLRGRCAHCGAPFDLRYPVVELVTGVAAVACVALFGLEPAAFRAFLFVAILIALTYIDLEHWLLPHAITWPGIALGLLTAFAPVGPGIVDALIGAAAGFGGFWLLRVVASAVFKKEALGGGDLYLLAMIGAFLGWQALLPVVFLASVQGSIIGIALILVHGRPEEGEGEGASINEEENADANQKANANEDENANQNPNAYENANANANENANDDEADTANDAPLDEDWTPPPHAVPFGPFLSLGALEMLFLGDFLYALFSRAAGLD